MDGKSRRSPAERWRTRVCITLPPVAIHPMASCHLISGWAILLGRKTVVRAESAARYPGVCSCPHVCLGCVWQGLDYMTWVHANGKPCYAPARTNP